MTQRESAIETLFREGVEALNGKAYKFVSPGEAGVADRVVVLPFIPVWFVELKRPGKGLEKLQELFREFVTVRGQRHATLTTTAEVAAWLAARAMEINRAKRLQ